MVAIYYRVNVNIIQYSIIAGAREPRNTTNRPKIPTPPRSNSLEVPASSCFAITPHELPQTQLQLTHRLRHKQRTLHSRFQAAVLPKVRCLCFQRRNDNTTGEKRYPVCTRAKWLHVNYTHMGTIFQYTPTTRGQRLEESDHQRFMIPFWSNISSPVYKQRQYGWTQSFNIVCGTTDTVVVSMISRNNNVVIPQTSLMKNNKNRPPREQRQCICSNITKRLSWYNCYRQILRKISPIASAT